MRRPLALLALSGCTWLGRDALDRDADGVPDAEDCDFHSPRASLGGAYIVYFQDNDGDGYGTGSPIERCVTELVDPGLVLEEGDCDDGDASLNPTTRWVPDTDGDGFATEGPVVTGCERPEGHIQEETAPEAVDCDDTNPEVNPGEVEVTGNAIDEDCDGSTEGDVDGDGFPTPFDCDDTDPDVHPAAVEVCNGIDDDCANGADEQDPNLHPSAASFLLYRDADGDGHPASLQGLLVCSEPTDPALVLASSLATDFDVDCDDTEPLAFPREQDPDLADAIDGDCDGVVYEDNDLDGVSSLTDCNDFDPSVYPGQAERCDPHDVDENCNGLADEHDPTLEEEGSVITGYADQDGDGYASSNTPSIFCELPSGFTDIPPTAAEDCDDTNPTINPGQPELCNGVDDDCANGADEADPNLQPSSTSFLFYRDADGDGHPASLEGLLVCTQPTDPELVLVGTLAADFGLDCDDTEPLAFPQAQDPDLSDPIDNDCDGVVYEDNDNDGVTSLTDCDDFDPTVNPAQSEICDPDGVDEDCNGLANDADPGLDPSTAVLGYPDLDDDGVAGSAQGTLFCVLPDDHLATAPAVVDCADQDPTVYPGQIESPPTEGDTSGTDRNCNGVVDYDLDGDGFWSAAAGGTDCDDTAPERYPGAVEQVGDLLDADCDGFYGVSCFPDEDADGYGAGAAEVIAANTCSGFVGARYAGIDGDCDDTDARRFPGATEVCDGVDNDCDGEEAYGIATFFDAQGYAIESVPLVDGATHDLSYGSEIALCGEQDGALSDALLDLGDLTSRSIWMHGVEIRPTDLERTRLRGTTDGHFPASVALERLSFTGASAYGSRIELLGYGAGSPAIADRTQQLSVALDDVSMQVATSQTAARIAAASIEIRDSNWMVSGARALEAYGELRLIDTAIAADGADISVKMEGGSIQGWAVEAGPALSTRIDVSGLVIVDDLEWTGSADTFLHVRSGGIVVLRDSNIDGQTLEPTVINEGLLYMQRSAFNYVELYGFTLVENRPGGNATFDQTAFRDIQMGFGYVVHNTGNMTLRDVVVEQFDCEGFLLFNAGVLEMVDSTVLSHGFGGLGPQLWSGPGSATVRGSSFHRLGPGSVAWTDGGSLGFESTTLTIDPDPTGGAIDDPVLRTNRTTVELLDTTIVHGGAGPVLDISYGTAEIRGNSLAWAPGGANEVYGRSFDLTDRIEAGIYAGGAAYGPAILITRSANISSTAPRTGTSGQGYDANGTLTTGVDLFSDPFGEVPFDLVDNAYGSFRQAASLCSAYSVYPALSADPTFGGCNQHLLELWISY